MKKGISLVVLVVTIIVTIIIASAAVITLNNTGIINSANKAVSDSRIKQLQVARGEISSDYNLSKDPNVLAMTLREYIIQRLKADYSLTNDELSKLNITSDGKMISAKEGSQSRAEGTEEIKLENSTGMTLANYKIYGSSTQNGNPTPSTPVRVEGLGTNKNIFNNQTNNIFWGYFISYSPVITPYAENAVLYVPCKANTTYTISGFDGTNNLIIGNVQTIPAQSVSVSNIVNSSSPKASTVYTTDSTAKFIVLLVLRDTDNATEGNKLSILRSNVAKMQIEEGSIATKYREGNYIDVKTVGINLLQNDIKWMAWTTNNAFDETKYTTPIKFESGKTYTLKFNSNGFTTYRLASHIYDQNGNIIVNNTSGNTTTASYYSALFEGVTENSYSPSSTNYFIWNGNRNVGDGTVRLIINSDCYISFALTLGDTTATSVMNNQIIYEGTGNLEYEPYKPETITTIDLTGHEPLMKIGDKADYIDYANRCIVRNVGKTEFTGADTVWAQWSEKSTDISIGLYYYNYDKLGTYQSPKFAIPGPLCTHYINGTNPYVVTDDERFCIAPSSAPPYIAFRALHTSMQGWLAWLTEQHNIGTPVTVYYQLVEPTTEPIDLPEIPTKTGTTNILVDGASKIELNYYMK